ncbi:MAG: ribbon-helix-helix domain-containing protein [Thermoplasmata archaeon]|nr:ribbon-helix-helix domain-containing protein [Thermoplasmata archaeon]
MNKERVDVRVEPELLEELDAIAERKGFATRSSAIREAIVEYVTQNGDSWNSAGINIGIPNRIAERLQRQIMNGDARDANEAIVLALDFWLRDMEAYYLRRRDRIERAVKENIVSDAALKELQTRGKDLEGL